MRLHTKLHTGGLVVASFSKLASGGVRASVYVMGRRKTKVLPTKAAARAWAVDMETELAAGPKLGAGITLVELFRRYEIEISPSKAGHKWESDRFAVIGKLPLGQVPLSDIQREHIEEWMLWRLESVKASTVNRELNLFSACFTQARRWRLMSHNPMYDLKRPKNPQHRDRLVSAFEVEQLKDAAGYSEELPVKTQTQRTMLAFLFALETAMRAGEICGICPEHVNTRDRTVYLAKTKNGTARTVPLSTEALRLLKRLPWEKGQPIIRLNMEVMSQLFRRTRQRAGLIDMVFHDSRHEAITRLAEKLDVLDLARMVGHKDVRQLMTYYNKKAKDIAKLLD